ncbi:hypothetical protein RJZ56_000439 [Blastomyces dermatitidis]|uniref:Uncharacterized protein n=2 Tax=Ajellomyces dermatitidis TaxID=5039 RepID=F2T278_AJEDA|nr:uncharacterized protein BDCG_03396 [Blastomyces dermatitidis ER-3]EEQ88276.1 hypothetical protein BDCG_03396 [Blastomyces dermatitidis ER-3]EGE77562.1 hypothetical protein BDDG_00499 [Blastomyces dermatitidis ATCC 18188]EQL33649.1 hypothetical protein BDFG_04389 [Blastomyces dermatitidis ATCC 26199]
MASTTSSAIAPTGSAICGTPAQYDIPTLDAACAVSNKNENKDFMDDCCKKAAVTLYNDGCALYCHAEAQTVQNLTSCLFEAGVPYNGVWCNKPQNATATGKSPTQTSTGTGTPTSTESPSAAAALNMPVFVQSGPTKLGIAVCAVVIPALIGGMMF